MYKIGDINIYRIIESEGPTLKPDELLRNFLDEKMLPSTDGLGPGFYDEATGSLILSVHSFLLQTASHTILIDTCIGNHKTRTFYPKGNQLNTSYLEDLKKIVDPEKVDYVICTHLHLDHVGWNVQLINGKLTPTFPNAQYIFSRADYEYWKRIRENHDTNDITDGCLEDSIMPIVESGQTRLIDNRYEIEDGIWIEPTPGHSPGHLCVFVSSNKEKAIFSGDIMHHPFQVMEPEWNTHFCNDPYQSFQTRKSFLTKYADSDIKIFPAHFPSPTMGKIISNKDSFYFLFDDDSSK